MYISLLYNEYLQRKTRGELPSRCTCGGDVANFDLSIRFDAGENGSNSKDRVQDAATGILAHVQRGGSTGVLPRLHRHDPRGHPVCRL